MQKIQYEVFGFLSATENKLVYYEIYPSAREAILREKQIKAGSRQKKINLIVKDNPKFKDLSEENTCHYEERSDEVISF